MSNHEAQPDNDPLFVYFHQRWNRHWEAARITAASILTLTALMGAKTGLTYAWTDPVVRERTAAAKQQARAAEAGLRQQALSRALRRPEALTALGGCATELQAAALRQHNQEVIGVPTVPSSRDYSAAAQLAAVHEVTCTVPATNRYNVVVGSEVVRLTPAAIA